MFSNQSNCLVGCLQGLSKQYWMFNLVFPSTQIGLIT